MKPTIVAAVIVTLLPSMVRAACIPLPDHLWPTPPLGDMAYYFGGSYSSTYADTPHLAADLQFSRSGRSATLTIFNRWSVDEVHHHFRATCNRVALLVTCSDPQRPSVTIEFHRDCNERLRIVREFSDDSVLYDYFAKD